MVNSFETFSSIVKLFLCRHLFTAYAGQPDMLPSHSGGRYSEADGRVKEIVEQINTTTSQESTESKTKHNTVIGKGEIYF